MPGGERLTHPTHPAHYTPVLVIRITDSERKIASGGGRTGAGYNRERFLAARRLHRLAVMAVLKCRANEAISLDEIERTLIQLWANAG
jgi:hypothetical protein